MTVVVAGVLATGAASAGSLATVHENVADEVGLGELVLADDADPPVRRAGGSERVATSVAASEEFRDAASTALLATAGDYPDALAATALATQRHAPLLLTHEERLPDPVADELERLGVEEVILLGGSDAIGEPVAGALDEQGYQVTRLAGPDRYATAAELATAVGPAETNDVVLALGAHDDPDRAWPDALASGALAASRDNVPTLLTATDRVPRATQEALAELEPERVLVVGGEASIEPSVMDQIDSLGFDAVRMAGDTRYETSVRLAAEALDRSDGGTRPLVLATGADFPDALAAGALAGALRAPLALTPTEELAPVVDRFVRRHRDVWDEGVIVGGQAAASETVAEQLGAALAGEPRPEPGPERTTDSDQSADGEEADGEEADSGEGDDEVVSTFEGEASWYGRNFHGQQTACGETFDMHDHTAAHRELPCGTRVRVTNTSSGQQVIVRVNDRGPWDYNRVMDLSRAAAEQIDMRAQGTTWIRGEVLAD